MLDELATGRSTQRRRPAPPQLADDELPTRRAARSRTRDTRDTRVDEPAPLAPPPVVARAIDVEAAPERRSAPSLTPPPDVATFDPAAIPLPGELAPSIYSWIRRLALQADLAGADRLLRDALAELTSSRSAAILYSGPDGVYSLGAGDEVPADPQAVIAVARSRRALVAPHRALIPIVTATETVAVIRLERGPRQPAFGPIEHVTMAALARESASVLSHLAGLHAQRTEEAAADQASLYRPEALQSHRRRGHEGALAQLSPTWVKRAYPLIITLLVGGLALGVCVRVPTYASGTAVVVFPGTPVTSPMPGTVAQIYVEGAQTVREGDLLVKLSSAKEEADLRQARTESESAQQRYLFDPSDEQVRRSLATARAAERRAEAALDQRFVRAPCDGTVSDVRIRTGGGLQFGDPILTIVAPGTEPELWAFLPGSDRPRLRGGMTAQVELIGFTKAREAAEITDVGRDVVGVAEARRALGPELADAIRLAPDGSYVLVKARLPGRTFRTAQRVYRYHHGMPAKTEVRVEDKRFLVTLLPALDKYLD